MLVCSICYLCWGNLCHWNCCSHKIKWWTLSMLRLLSRPNNGTSFPYSAGTIITTSIFVFCWLPSLMMLLISTTWSCITFKMYYTGGNNQLNRRLISLPIILPASFILNTLFNIVLLRHLVLVVIPSLFKLLVETPWEWFIMTSTCGKNAAEEYCILIQHSSAAFFPLLSLRLSLPNSLKLQIKCINFCEYLSWEL